MERVLCPKPERKYWALGLWIYSIYFSLLISLWDFLPFFFLPLGMSQPTQYHHFVLIKSFASLTRYCAWIYVILYRIPHLNLFKYDLMLKQANNKMFIRLPEHGEQNSKQGGLWLTSYFVQARHLGNNHGSFFFTLPLLGFTLLFCYFILLHHIAFWIYDSVTYLPWLLLISCLCLSLSSPGLFLVLAISGFYTGHLLVSAKDCTQPCLLYTSPSPRD